FGRRGNGGGRARHSSASAARTAAASAAAPTPAAAGRDLRVQLAQFLLDLLAGMGFGAGHEQAAGERGRLTLARERRLIAESQIDGAGDDVVGGLLREDRDLHAVGE